MGELNYPRSEVARREIAKKHKSEKSPLGPQVHAADIPQDSRTHMDKKAKIS